MFLEIVARSYMKFLGQPIMDGPFDAQWLYWNAPFGLLVHNADDNGEHAGQAALFPRWAPIDANVIPVE